MDHSLIQFRAVRERFNPSQNHPNLFDPIKEIDNQLVKSSSAPTRNCHDVGKVLKAIVHQTHKPGHYMIDKDGKNNGVDIFKGGKKN